MARGLSDLQKWILAALAKRRGRNRTLLFSEIKHGFRPYAARADDPAVAVIVSKAVIRLERRGLVQVVYFNVSGTPRPRLKGRRAGYWAGIVLTAGGRAKALELREGAIGQAAPRRVWTPARPFETFPTPQTLWPPARPLETRKR